MSDTMTHPLLTLNVTGAVATLTLQRPNRFNALNGALLSALQECLQTLATRDDVRALVLTGAGRAFCSGADMAADAGDGATRDYAQLLALPEPERSTEMRRIGDATRDGLLDQFHPLIRLLSQYPKAVVAAVNGTAAGGGVGLALACDIVVAARSAQFVQVFAPRLGLVPDCGLTWQMPRRVGQARSLALALLGEALSAEQAEAMGLIWRVVDDEQLPAEAARIASRLAANPGHVNHLVKLALQQAQAQDLPTQLDLEARLQGDCGARPSFIEGVLAFQQKRAPEFHPTEPAP